MIERFSGERGRALLINALSAAKLAGGDVAVATALADCGTLIELPNGATLIDQGDATNDVFILVAGHCEISINGRRIAARGPGDHVGEMAAIQPTQPRSASVIAKDTVVALQLTEESFSKVGSRHAQIYKTIAQELSRRLLQRNSTIGAFREKIRVFIISSVESLAVARILENAFEYDPFTVEIWNAGCFKVANYTIDDLESAVDNADFAIAIAHPDDHVTTRGEDWPVPRDNVIFELGLFMGRLGRKRAILMEPRDTDIKLPSDLAGITTIPYRFEKGGENSRLMGPACNRLRDHIVALGPNNG